MEELYRELYRTDPRWSVAYTPWGDNIICILTVNKITRSATGNNGATALVECARMFDISTPSSEGVETFPMPTGDMLAIYRYIDQLYVALEKKNMVHELAIISEIRDYLPNYNIND